VSRSTFYQLTSAIRACAAVTPTHRNHDPTVLAHVHRLYRSQKH